jgi:2-keto-4-pentenoate hydratase
VQLSEAYGLQALGQARGGKTPMGYKLGATSRKAQEFLQLSGPFYGRLYAQDCYQDGARLRAGDFIFRLIEPEFALVLARDLPARAQAYDEAEVAAAVARVCPAFEIVTSAYGAPAWTSAGAPALIADNGAHGAIILGQGRGNWDLAGLRGLAEVEARLWVDGREIGAGRGENAMGGPLTALTWLANALRGVGSGLRAGEVVSTGVVTPFLELQAGQSAQADFGSLGKLGFSFL